MAIDAFNPYLFVSAGEQSNKFLTPAYADGIAQFQAQRAQSLTGLTVRIDLIQEGTGDPSPTNIRPISGRTGMTVTVQSGETQKEYPVTWESIAGTVYGGTLDVVSGVLTVTHAYWTKNTATMNNSELFPGWVSSGIKAIIGEKNDIIRRGVTGNVGTVIGVNTLYDIVYMPKTHYADMTQTDWIAMALDVQFVLRLATPQTYRLTPTEVRTIAGFNQIYSDAGPVIDIKF